MRIFLILIGFLLITSGVTVLVFPLTGLVDALVPFEFGIDVGAIITGFVFGGVGLTQRKRLTPEKARGLNISSIVVLGLLIVLDLLCLLVSWRFHLGELRYFIQSALFFGLYGLWVVLDKKTGRTTRIPFWIYIVLVFITLLLDAATTLLSLLLLTGVVYAVWRLGDGAFKRSSSFPFWVFLVVLVPVFLFTYHTFGIFWGG